MSHTKSGVTLNEDQVQIVSADGDCPELPIVSGEGSARAVIWPGMGAELRSMHLIELADGASTIDLRHPMEAVYFVIEGAGVAEDGDERHDVQTGCMIFVEPDTTYRIEARGGLRLVGGPCPPDPSLYEELKRG